MKRIIVLLAAMALSLCCLCACSVSDSDAVESGGEENAVYLNISAAEAKEIMDTQSGYIILDVRTEEEYAAGHIAGAILIPDYEIDTRAESELPDKDQLILVYCRSGRRSKNAAQMLLELGYTDIREFGGIIDWPYDIEK